MEQAITDGPEVLQRFIDSGQIEELQDVIPHNDSDEYEDYLIDDRSDDNNDRDNDKNDSQNRSNSPFNWDITNQRRGGTFDNDDLPSMDQDMRNINQPFGRSNNNIRNNSNDIDIRGPQLELRSDRYDDDYSSNRERNFRSDRYDNDDDDDDDDYNDNYDDNNTFTVWQRNVFGNSTTNPFGGNRNSYQNGNMNNGGLNFQAFRNNNSGSNNNSNSSGRNELNAFRSSQDSNQNWNSNQDFRSNNRNNYRGSMRNNNRNNSSGQNQRTRNPWNNNRSGSRGQSPRGPQRTRF